MEVKILRQTTAMDWKLIAVLFMIRASFAFISFKQRIITSLFISGVVKTGVENKKNIRKIILPCIIKIVILVTVLWLIY